MPDRWTPLRWGAIILQWIARWRNPFLTLYPTAKLGRTYTQHPNSDAHAHICAVVGERRGKLLCMYADGETRYYFPDRVEIIDTILQHPVTGELYSTHAEYSEEEYKQYEPYPR